MNASRRSGLLPLLGRLWHNLFMAGRRRNHQLLGFYRYHLDTCKSVAHTISTHINALRRSPRARKVARNALFWPMMALATTLLYTGAAPYAWRLVLPMPNGEYAGVVPAGDAMPKGVDVASGSAPTDAAFAAPKGDKQESGSPVAVASASQQSNSDDDDPVVEALAQLPAFVPEEAALPVMGDIVQETGWYRHPVYDDWRMSPGVVIEPDTPGSAVQSAYSGVVVEVRKEEDGVWSVRLAHRDGWESEYHGLGSASVQPHDVVEKGASIGHVPTSGAKQVSFVLRHENELVDPSKYLP